MHSIDYLHKTNTGRVVYKRKKHTFSAADIARITKAATEEADFPFLEKLLHDMSTFVLSKILVLFGAEKFTESVYQFMLAIVNWALAMVGGTTSDLYKKILSYFAERISSYNSDRPTSERIQIFQL